MRCLILLVVLAYSAVFWFTQDTTMLRLSAVLDWNLISTHIVTLVHKNLYDIYFIQIMAGYNQAQRYIVATL